MKEWICEEVPAVTIDGKLVSTMLHQEQELVRCKDCIYYTEPDSQGDRCDKIHWPRGDDWFCADGKRRDDDD